MKLVLSDTDIEELIRKHVEDNFSEFIGESTIVKLVGRVDSYEDIEIYAEIELT